MKMKIKELNANPYKKEISHGKLSQEQIDKLKANIEELGLMGSLPVFKHGGKYYLIAGHHRVEALRQIYGDDCEVEVTFHDYSKEQIFRGMVVENLTQRSDEFKEVAENLSAIRRFLKTENVAVRQADSDNPSRQPQKGSLREIASWLNKNGEVISLQKISDYLRIYDNLDEEILDKVEKTSGGVKKDGESLTVKEAELVSRVDKADQKLFTEALKKVDANKDDKSVLVTKFKGAPEEIREDILKGEANLKDIDWEIQKKQPYFQNNKEDWELMPTAEDLFRQFKTRTNGLGDQVNEFGKVFNQKEFKEKYDALSKDKKDKLKDFLKQILEIFEYHLKTVKDLIAKLD